MKSMGCSRNLSSYLSTILIASFLMIMKLAMAIEHIFIEMPHHAKST